MRVGVCILPELPWAQAAPLWRRAEELGFDHAWTYDHMTWSPLPDVRWFAAVPTLTAAAMITSRIGLGTFVSSPNNHHPAQFIREVLALDDISAGRLLLGVGAGGNLDSELTGGSLSRKDRTVRFREFTELMSRLLHEDDVTYTGHYFTAAGVGTRPGPVNATGVPLLVAANGPLAMKLAVERGDGWITYAGHADGDDAWWALVAATVARFEETFAASGRDRPMDRYLGLDSAPTNAFSSVDAFADAVGRAAELGFTDVVSVWPRPTAPYAASPAVLEDIAARGW